MDEIRNQGRKIVELSALATPREHRWKNIFLYLVQVMYWYSVYTGVDDICIAVNPRHVRFYKHMFPFEVFGPERNYARVEAPAVGLRGKVRESMEQMVGFCKDLDFDTPLYAYYYRMTGVKPQQGLPFLEPEALDLTVQTAKRDKEAVQRFIDLDPGILADLNEVQRTYLVKSYPGLRL